MPNDNSRQNQLIKQKNSIAKLLSQELRQDIGAKALSKTCSITDLAETHSTSRKFIYAQKDKAQKALKEAFSKQQADSEILYHIPVTKAWLSQTVLSLTLSCHSSYAGVIEFFRDILDRKISKGSVHNIIHQQVSKAAKLNQEQDLSAIKIGAHDEIFQGTCPVLTGCDLESTYVYLLKLEESRDATTWGTRLLELSEQGLDLDYTIADGGKGLRKGQEEAWPKIPCRGDVFHPLLDMRKLLTFLENQANRSIEAVEKLEKKMVRAKGKQEGGKYSRQLGHLRKKMRSNIHLRDDIAALASWLHKDVLSVIGPDFESRVKLMSFIVEELKCREEEASHRITPVRKLLEKQKTELLEFVAELDNELNGIAENSGLDLQLVRQAFDLQGIPIESQRYWLKRSELYKLIGKEYYKLELNIKEVIGRTIRASSLVENLNSRLRNYFFLRKTLGQDYLELLQFFFNHRCYLRSNRPERVGKSPKALLENQAHPHWLELLGFTLFKKEKSLRKAA